MAGPLQAGDIVAFGKLAWEVYQLGFTDEHNATKQYTEFGRDVRGLAENLDTLTEVVGRAKASLDNQSQVPMHNATVRWDESSLEQIIGDYKSTLRECHGLIRSNQRYYRTNVMRNIEWNVLIQPNADRLRQRILLHNSKIFHFLKPFEIDLLCRVREDIQMMHADLANRITHLHYDLHRFMGVMVPDLETELSNRQQRQIYLLDVPGEISDRFRIAALTDRPEYDNDEAFGLGELSDAFILNFHKSTRIFQSGQRVADRIPTLEQYLNLLKCVWLFQRMRRDVPEAVEVSSDSHWPSYVRQLEDELSVECTRFKRELVRPEMSPTIRRDMFSVWPEKEELPLLDLATRDEMMEELLEAPLESSSTNIERSVRLLRRLGSDGRRYRIMLSGTETTPSSKPRAQTEVIDFDLASAVINPHYAMPNSGGFDKEIILQRDERIARLSFTSMKNVLKFQQAVTGFKAWDSYSEYNVLVSFVVAGLEKPVVESACVQLWIPKTVDGSFVTNTDANGNADGEPRRSGTLSTVPPGGSPDLGRARGSSGTFADRPIPIRGADSMASTQRQGRSATILSSSWPRQASPGPISASPPRSTGMMGPPGRHYSSSTLGSSPPGQRQSPITRKPVGGAQPNSPSRSGTLASTGSNTLNVPIKSSRTLSMSSNVSQAVSTGNSNSSNDSHTYTVSTGSNSTGFVHRTPPKPKLVLFTQSEKDQKVSFVSIDIDDETQINAERCNCRRAGPDGSSCKITALERNRGNTNLDARRYETTKRGDMDWNLARLALNGPEAPDENTTWPGLKRVSFMFPTPQARANFGGMPNQCRCKTKTEGELRECLLKGHRGLLGEVQEFYRQQMNDYHKLRYEGHQQVVNGLMI